MNTTGTVAKPVSTNAAPSANTIGQMEAPGAYVAAATASSSVNASPSRVNRVNPATSAEDAATPKRAIAPRSEGLIKNMYKIAETSAMPVRPTKYLELGVNMSTYFCTYTKNHKTVNAAVRKYQYNACEFTTSVSSSRPPTERNNATKLNAIPPTTSSNIAPVIA